MKKILIMLFFCIPVTILAQTPWERPDFQNQAQQASKKNAKKQKDDTKYLTGAVPEENGMVVFKHDIEVPGRSSQQLYEVMLEFAQELTTNENQIEGSNVSLVNKQDYVIAASVKEWLVFKSTFLELDATKFLYSLIIKCSDGHIHAEASRLSYRYEEDRPTALRVKAEEWINDNNALNKQKTKLTKGSAKFRRKTVDRMEELFKEMDQFVQQQTTTD